MKHEHGEWDIQINGRRLTSAESMTVRVALNNFGMDLTGCNSKEPPAGSIEASYMARLRDILRSAGERS